MVKNALKFTLNGVVAIKASYNEAEGFLVVHVCDTGAGIDRADFPKLFTRFGKLHRTAHMNSTGIGLGLTIVKQIVESAQGQIEVRSDGVNKGSTFIFSMRLNKVQESQFEEVKHSGNLAGPMLFPMIAPQGRTEANREIQERQNDPSKLIREDEDDEKEKQNESSRKLLGHSREQSISVINETF